MTHSIFPQGKSARLRDRIVAVLNRCHWPSLFAGAAAGFAGLYFQTTQPLLSHVRQLEHRIGSIHSQLDQLAGAGRHAQQANNLLGVLIAQGERVAAAREALDAMTDLQRAVAINAAQADEAAAVAGRWHDLANSLVAARDMQAQAARAVEQIDALQQDIAALGAAADDGQAAIATTRAMVTDVSNLQLQLAATAEATSAARNALDGIDALQQRLAAGGEFVATAGQSADKLIELQQRLSALPQLDAASANAEQLIRLQQTLSADSRLQIAAATHNAEQLLDMQRVLAGETAQLAAGVENLELLADFQDELDVQLARVAEMRRQLTELMLLEATVSRTMTALAPLAELGNLRQLDDAEVREIARMMLERRRERAVAAEQPSAAPGDGESAVADRRVPEPPAE